ncbi:hypothetical protein PAMP_019593 [Pampus punctatissimus]
MGDGSVTPRLGNMKALLGIVAGAGASYGIYKLISGGSFKRNKKSATNEGPGVRSSQPSQVTLKPGSLLAKVSGLDVVCARPVDTDGVDVASGDIIHQSPGNLEPQHLKMLLSCLKTSNNPSDRCRFLLTLGNAAAFTVNQNLIREYEGIYIIAGFLSDPAAEVRVHTLNALNNLCMNIPNQEQLKVQALKVLVNLSSNPDMVDDIVQAQAPASVVLLFDARTAPPVLLRLLTFAGNLKAWTPSAQVADELRRKQDCLFRVMLDESSQLHNRLVQLLSHPDREIQAQVARILT